MPLYEYGCPSCETTTDVRHGFDETPKLTCEVCKTPLKRQFSAAPIVFKGSGFYVNDSRSKSTSDVKKTDKSDKSETKPDTKTDSKTDSKTETKPETKTEKTPSGDKKSETAA